MRKRSGGVQRFHLSPKFVKITQTNSVKQQRDWLTRRLVIPGLYDELDQVNEMLVSYSSADILNSTRLAVRLKRHVEVDFQHARHTGIDHPRQSAKGTIRRLKRRIVRVDVKDRKQNQGSRILDDLVLKWRCVPGEPVTSGLHLIT